MKARLAGCIAAASVIALTARVSAIETTYGEDPVPNTRCYKGFIDLGYGIDPIPAKTLSQRWHEWRAARSAAPGTHAVGRAPSAGPPLARPGDALNPRPTAKSRWSARAR